MGAGSPGNSPRVEFVDALLLCLGMKSVTTEKLADHPEGVEDILHTGFYGKSFYSTRNRDMLLQALGREPAPVTLGELLVALEGVLQEASDEDGEPVLGALRRACEHLADQRLDDIVRS